MSVVLNTLATATLTTVPTWAETAVWLMVAADIVTRLLLIIRVILRRLEVPTALAWLVLLFFVPFASTGLYALLGENRLGYRKALKIDAVTQARARVAMVEWQARTSPVLRGTATYSPIAALCQSVGGFAPVPGNAMELMDDASAVLARLEADIAAAVHHCHLLYYIWQPNGGGERIGRALIAAAKRGVRCRVLVDAVGSKQFLRGELCAAMREGGVMVVEALPVNPLRMLFARIDLRNHRKIAVVDGRIAYCGSQNLTDEFFRNPRTKKLASWIDLSARIEGPCVYELQTVFLQDWSYDSHEALGDLGQFFPAFPEAGTSVAQVVPSGPGSGRKTIHAALLAMIYAARKELMMTTPYFVPDEAVKAALVGAALRGVEVTLILPDELDMRLVAAASRSHYEDLLEVGIRIMHHEGGLLHAKAVVVDQELALVTSANLDMRSFWLNFEVSLMVYDDDFAGLLRFSQIKYMHESTEVHLAQWRTRPIWRRFLDNVAQLAGPLL